MSLEQARSTATKVTELGADAILIGGSTAVDQLALKEVIKEVKDVVTIPVILFPGNVTGVSPGADAILFASLLNSDDPYFIIGAQALGSMLVKKHGIEPLSTGYIIAGEGGAAGFVGRTRSFPQNKPSLVALYALAAQYLGMKYVYLEAGSGAASNISSDTIKKVRALYENTLIVGGGIKDEKAAESAISSGADILVIGNLVEAPGFEGPLSRIIGVAHKEPRQR